MLAATDAVLVGQLRGFPPAPFATAWFQRPDGSTEFGVNLPSLPGAAVLPDASLAVARNGSEVLYGGRWNDRAFTLRQETLLGVGQVLRDLHPFFAVSSMVEGVHLDRDGASFIEVAVGSVTVLNPQATWWRNGALRYFRVPAGTAGSLAHGLSGYQTVQIYENGAYALHYVPAHLAIGEYLPPGEPYTRACLWANSYFQPLDYTFRDLHPPRFLWSRALGVGHAHVDEPVVAEGVYQRVVGEGCPDHSSHPHALIWPNPELDGGEAQVRDVHPPEFQSSRASATFNNRTVGRAETTDGRTHAMLWVQYTPVDLHRCFPGAVDSDATAVLADGSIAGWWREATGAVQSFLLKPDAVPETAADFGVGIVADDASLRVFNYLGVSFRYAAINDTGTTAFIAADLRSGGSHVFTRCPGGYPVPLVAAGQPYLRGVISALMSNGEAFGLDNAGVVHLAFGVTTATNEISVVARFRPDGGSEVILKTGDPLPEGRVFDTVRYVRASVDGRTGIRTGARSGHEIGHSILLHQGGTNTLIVRNDYHYPSLTQTTNNFAGLELSGVTTNGDVFFTAGRSGYDPNDPSVRGRTASLWRWSKGQRTELIAPGSPLGGGWLVAEVSQAHANEQSEAVFLARATNGANRTIRGYWRLPAGSTTPGAIVLQDDLVPGGAVTSFGYQGRLNGVGEFLFDAVVDGQRRFFVSRSGHDLEAFFPAEGPGGTLYVFPGAMNRHREVVGVRFRNSSENGQVELIAPRPRLVNSRPVAGGVTCDMEAPILDRPYTIRAATEATGPWVPLPYVFNATAVRTQFTDADPAVPHRFLRAERLP